MSLTDAHEILKKFSQLAESMPMSYALTLLEVAQDEGLSITSLAERLDTPLSTISRVVAAMSDVKKYNLLTVTIAKDEKRRKIITLTQRAKDFLKTI